ncbi:hypothetical protein MUK42_27353 [Musa troglodytarum]|uniref:Uncharacterized protein n=1 Tax=Musa troglodytarum TaxID=320322 RepID=A0A9E7FMM2_9LILI|nr:hypothetical protein MUK42_27353 [Musa troglodytarum]
MTTCGLLPLAPGGVSGNAPSSLCMDSTTHLSEFALGQWRQKEQWSEEESDHRSRNSSYQNSLPPITRDLCRAETTQHMLLCLLSLGREDSLHPYNHRLARNG